jgi:hypothetical protein
MRPTVGTISSRQSVFRRIKDEIFNSDRHVLNTLSTNISNEDFDILGQYVMTNLNKHPYKQRNIDGPFSFFILKKY